MNETVTIDLAHAVPADTAAAPRMPAHWQSLLDLPAGEARDRLLAVHGILGTIRNNDYAQQTILGDIQSIVPGINNGPVDLQFLRARPLIDSRIERDTIERAFEEAQINNGWLIFHPHDVADTPRPYGCSPALPTYALEVAPRRKTPVRHMAEALLCAGA